MTDIKKTVERISTLFGITEPLYGWCYGADGRLLCSSAPNSSTLDAVFSLCACKQRMTEHYAASDRPYVAGLPFGLVWMTATKRLPDGTKLIYALGPAYSAEVTSSQIRHGLHHCVDKDPGVISISELMAAIDKLPTVPSLVFQRYVLMLHYELNQEKLELGDIFVNNKFDPGQAEDWHREKDRHKIYLSEQALLQNVREGNRNYQQALTNAAGLSRGVPVHSGSDALRSGKTSATVFISLCTRAAIEGGLSPEEAYSLGDRYIQTAENCTNYNDIMACNHDMYADFIHRVHKRKNAPKLSVQIQTCRDYIDFHVDEKLRIGDLAQLAGYSEYYLSKKFKQEMGITINQYIRDTKIWHARQLLSTTELSIDAIADALGFSSRGYFSEVFHQITGFSPAHYRSVHKKV